MKKILLALSAVFFLLTACSDGNIKEYNKYYANPGHNTGPDEVPEDTTPMEPAPEENIPDNAEYFKVTVMSFNVRVSTGNDGNNSWANRRKAFKPMLSAYNPMVLGTQETRRDQMQYLVGQWTNYNVIGVGRVTGKPYTDNSTGSDEFVPIWYDKNRIELLNSGNFWLSNNIDTPNSKFPGGAHPRVCTWGHFRHKSTGKEFMYFNTHIDVNCADDVPGKQMEVLADRITRLNTKNLPVLCTADFNKETDDVPNIFSSFRTIGLKNLRSYCEEGFTDHNDTYNNWGNSHKTVDHIYYMGMEPYKFKTVIESYANVPFISDHYPISGTLNYKLN